MRSGAPWRIPMPWWQPQFLLLSVVRAGLGSCTYDWLLGLQATYGRRRALRGLQLLKLALGA
eukprot:3642948-Heterocapsa_arctica.AAC.1